MSKCPGENPLTGATYTVSVAEYTVTVVVVVGAVEVLQNKEQWIQRNFTQHQKDPYPSANSGRSVGGGSNVMVSVNSPHWCRTGGSGGGAPGYESGSTYELAIQLDPNGPKPQGNPGQNGHQLWHTTVVVVVEQVLLVIIMLVVVVVVLVD